MGHVTDRPIITFVVACYNSSAYMDRCLTSLVTGADDIEVIIVDDGSTDDTSALADRWQSAHPGVVKVIHQSNKGHGGAVNAGLAAATGEYFFVVDSDDWLNAAALDEVLLRLRGIIASDKDVDLVITNFAYEHAATRSHKIIRYKGVLPRERIFSWDDVGPLGPFQNLTMHSMIYRTQVLRDAGLVLPEHMFYVDNLFAYVPLPLVKTLYYLSVDLYRYFIGRDDQSVSHDVLIGHLDQHIAVALRMVDAVPLPGGAHNRWLASYMTNFLGRVLVTASAIAVLDGSPAALAQRQAMWDHIERVDPVLKATLMRQFFVRGANLPGTAGRNIAKAGYLLAQRIYRFN